MYPKVISDNKVESKAIMDWKGGTLQQ